MGVSPGGVREALFSDEYYTILWGNRAGFAKVALRANTVGKTALQCFYLFNNFSCALIFYKN